MNNPQEHPIDDEQEQPMNEQELTSEQAAVQMPSVPPDGRSGDVVGAPATPPNTDHHPMLFEQTSHFWQQPLPPHTYIEPPFYPHAPQTEQDVQDFQQHLRQAGYEVEAIDLRFKFRTLIQASGYELEQLRHELEPLRLQLQQQLYQCKLELLQKKNEFIQQMAQARLPLPKSDRKSSHPSSVIITPHLVEEALTHDFATADEICGQHGVTPTGETESRWAIFYRVGQWLLDLGAPFFAGLILGINIAAITGFLRLEDFRQGRQMWLVALAAFIGFFIEKLVGTVYYQLASALAQASELPFDDEEARPFPRLRATFILSGLGLFTLLLGAAVVVVDALGLRMLHEQAVQQAKLLGTEAGEVLPFWVYLIAGCVISLPYLIYKAMMGWRQGELRLREARIAYLRWKHIEARRGETAVQEAFRLAQEVVGLQERYQWLQEQLQEVRARLDSARTQSVGCRLRYDQYWDALRDQLIAQRENGLPPRQQGRELPLNRRAMGEQPATWLRRFMRWFRRD
ncbi:hypothetical protein HRbin15_01209 [bacterium HR15]|nr:hypothetical protein HRbin15_01209 [bacterium HR15]